MARFSFLFWAAVLAFVTTGSQGCKPDECVGQANQAFSSCEGSAAYCDYFSSEPGCFNQIGCYWDSYHESCEGISFPCDGLDADQCGTQVGCSGGSVEVAPPAEGNAPGCNDAGAGAAPTTGGSGGSGPSGSSSSGSGPSGSSSSGSGPSGSSSSGSGPSGSSSSGGSPGSSSSSSTGGSPGSSSSSSTGGSPGSSSSSGAGPGGPGSSSGGSPSP